MCDHPGPEPAAPVPHADRRGLDRRSLFLAGAGLAAAGAVTVVEPALAADDGKVRKIVFEGRFTDPSTPDWHYLPFKVPRGTARIDVWYDYEPTDTGIGLTTNVVDIGIFGPAGHELGNAAGFRGWSGGARRKFHLTRGSATPGYRPGPIKRGTWHVILGPYLINGAGTPYKVVVTLTPGPRGPAFEPSTAPQEVAGTGPGWFRGDLHTHTVHSDGRWTQPLLAEAAQAAGLHVLGSSEHNTSTATRTWGRYAPDDLLVVNGEEVTTRAGHWLAMGLPPGTWIDWRYRAEDAKLPEFVDLVHEAGGVAVVCHPNNPVPSIKWGHGADWAGMDAVELWNGPWTGDDQTTVGQWHGMLVQGRFVPGVGSSDSHHDGQTVGLAQSVYRMDSLSTSALLDAVRGGHCWIAESSGVDLTFTAVAGEQVAECGDTLAAAPGTTATVTLSASGVPGSLARVLGPTGILGFAVADDAGAVAITVDVPVDSTPFVRAEVGRPKGDVGSPVSTTPIDKMAALTNPIFLTT